MAISDDHAHTLYKLAHMTGFVGWLNEFRKSLAAGASERADAEKDAALDKLVAEQERLGIYDEPIQASC